MEYFCKHGIVKDNLKEMLYGEHDSAMVYVEKLQATILGLEIRKKLAIRERLNNI